LTEPAVNEVMRRARLNAGFTKRGLAREAKVGVETVRRLEAGKGARPSNAKRVADAIGLQVTDLMPVDLVRNGASR